MEEKQIEERERIISDICPFHKKYGSCEQCNADLIIDVEPCYYGCIVDIIIENNYRKQIEGEWVTVGNGITERVVCSNCKTEKGSFMRPPFCNQCGAKMKGIE